MKSYKEDGRPSFQFYPDDWLSEPGLTLCSLAAQGLWIRMLCYMWKANLRGYLMANDKKIDSKCLAKLCGEDKKTIEKLLKELEENKVFSVSKDDIIFSRRMEKDEQIRKVRTFAGQQGGLAKGLAKSKQNVSKRVSKMLAKGVAKTWHIGGEGEGEGEGIEKEIGIGKEIEKEIEVEIEKEIEKEKEKMKDNDNNNRINVNINSISDSNNSTKSGIFDNKNAPVSDLTPVVNLTPPSINPSEKRLETGVKKSALDTSKFPFLQEKDFEKTYQDYLDMRKKKKRPATVRAEELVLTTLHKYSKETAIKMIEQSIRNSWTDVYEIKYNDKSDNLEISFDKAYQMLWDSVQETGQIDKENEDVVYQKAKKIVFAFDKDRNEFGISDEEREKRKKVHNLLFFEARKNGRVKIAKGEQNAQHIG